jgi:uncharacterized membrane protein (Fun14 family)
LPLVIGFYADYALEELLKVCLWIDAVEPATLSHLAYPKRGIIHIRKFYKTEYFGI